MMIRRHSNLSVHGVSQDEWLRILQTVAVERVQYTTELVKRKVDTFKDQVLGGSLPSHEVSLTTYPSVYVTSDIRGDLRRLVQVLLDGRFITSRLDTVSKKHTAKGVYTNYGIYLMPGWEHFEWVAKPGTLLLILGDLVGGRHRGLYDVDDQLGAFEIGVHVFLFNLRLKARAHGSEVRFTLGNEDTSLMARDYSAVRHIPHRAITFWSLHRRTTSVTEFQPESVMETRTQILSMFYELSPYPFLELRYGDHTKAVYLAHAAFMGLAHSLKLQTLPTAEERGAYIRRTKDLLLTNVTSMLWSGRSREPWHTLKPWRHSTSPFRQQMGVIGEPRILDNYNDVSSTAPFESARLEDARSPEHAALAQVTWSDTFAQNIFKDPPTYCRLLHKLVPRTEAFDLYVVGHLPTYGTMGDDGSGDDASLQKRAATKANASCGRHGSEACMFLACNRFALVDVGMSKPHANYRHPEGVQQRMLSSTVSVDIANENMRLDMLHIAAYEQDQATPPAHPGAPRLHLSRYRIRPGSAPEYWHYKPGRLQKQRTAINGQAPKDYTKETAGTMAVGASTSRRRSSTCRCRRRSSSPGRPHVSKKHSCRRRKDRQRRRSP